MPCKAEERIKEKDIGYAKAFSDEALLSVASNQVRYQLRRVHEGYSYSASQAHFDRQVRREILRRGLTWKPPTDYS